MVGMKHSLLTPIPNLDKARQVKLDYRKHPLDPDTPYYHEPLVALADYGISGVSYYSRKNNITGDPVPGVSPDIFVRQSVAEKLVGANEVLRTSEEVRHVFGGPLELHVADGFRPPELVALIHDKFIPELLRKQHPDWTEQQIKDRRGNIVAYPEWSKTSMPPHYTGGAIDVGLKHLGGERLDVGHGPAELGKDAIYTDYLEQHALGDELLEGAVQARRVLYNLLTSAEVGDHAMANNPTEEWHFSLFDQMWAKLTGQPAAFYGVPEDLSVLKQKK